MDQRPAFQMSLPDVQLLLETQLREWPQEQGTHRRLTPRQPMDCSVQAARRSESRSWSPRVGDPCRHPAHRGDAGEKIGRAEYSQTDCIWLLRYTPLPGQVQAAAHPGPSPLPVQPCTELAGSPPGAPRAL